MSLHILLREQFIPAPRQALWEYFCDPHNLNELTPPDMNFTILGQPLERMYAGQLIEYRVEFIRGIQSPWLTEIAHVREGEYFVDEQRRGPYQFWYHEHRFEASDGGTQMIDRVTYSIGFGPLGDALNTFWIGPRLNKIFDYRTRMIKKLFTKESTL